MFQAVASRAVGSLGRVFRCGPRAGLVAMLLAVACLAGCDGEPYQPMSGVVTVDGTPLEKGVITFFPIGPGTTVGGEIIDGSFELAQERGGTPGKYRVEIVAFRPSGRKEFDIDLNEAIDIEVQYLPPKYNVKSTLEAEVLDSEPNQYEFELVTK